MTIMFRAAGVTRTQLHAVLTPTTRGVRAALDADGESQSRELHRSMVELVNSASFFCK